MNRLFAFLSLMMLYSCDFIESKKVYSKDILEEELQTFNWKDVDEYPTFDSCDTALDRANRRLCFENTLGTILNEKLSQYTIVVSEKIHDTVQLKIRIDSKGILVVNDVESKSTTRKAIPQLDSLLRHSLDTLPKIYPAIKRSQQVTTEFSLPVIIKM
jgi:hypothetical protein